MKRTLHIHGTLSTNNYWLSDRSRLNPLIEDYKLWSEFESMDYETSRRTMNSLKDTLTKTASDTTLETVHATVANYQLRLRVRVIPKVAISNNTIIFPLLSIEPIIFDNFAKRSKLLSMHSKQVLLFVSNDQLLALSHFNKILTKDDSLHYFRSPVQDPQTDNTDKTSYKF